MTDRQSTHGHDCWGWGPKHYECAVREIKALRAEVAAWRELSDRMEAVLDQLQAENERLRAEVDGWKAQHSRDSAELRRLCQHRDEYKARAERMEEALALLPDEIVMVEHNPDEGPLMFCCGRKVKLTWLHDLEPTHNEGCWYARMRALRDAALHPPPPHRRITMRDLIERLRSVKWDVIADGDRMPDDPTRECVFVDMRPDEFEALLRETAAALEAAREDAEPVVRFNDDGTLDEVVGRGQFHLEQMGSGHWWMQLGPHIVNLSARGKIRAHFGRNEAAIDQARGKEVQS